MWVVSLLSILIALAAIGLAVAGFVMLRRSSAEQARKANEMDARLQQVRAELDRKLNLMDMAEFRSLDPVYRDAYKRMIVDKLMPAFARLFNKESAAIAPHLADQGLVSQVVNKVVKVLDSDLTYLQKMAALDALDEASATQKPESAVEAFVDSAYFTSRLTHAWQVANAKLDNIG